MLKKALLNRKSEICYKIWKSVVSVIAINEIMTAFRQKVEGVRKLEKKYFTYLRKY